MIHDFVNMAVNEWHHFSLRTDTNCTTFKLVVLAWAGCKIWNARCVRTYIDANCLGCPSRLSSDRRVTKIPLLFTLHFPSEYEKGCKFQREVKSHVAYHWIFKEAWDVSTDISDWYFVFSLKVFLWKDMNEISETIWVLVLFCFLSFFQSSQGNNDTTWKCSLSAASTTHA